MHDHLVEFYETEAQVTDSVRNFIAPSLASGGSALIIATAQHRQAFCSSISDAGIDLAAASQQGRFAALDARQTLDQFMVDSQPHPLRFFEAIGRTLHLLPVNDNPPSLYGEMVSLLWAEGNVAGAIELERLWNRLSEMYSFKLLCAYPLSLFDLESGSADFWEVCGDHTVVRLRFAEQPPAGGELPSLKQFMQNIQRMKTLAEGHLVADQSAGGFTYEMRRGLRAV